ncbi:MAG: hypothetical protein IT501_07760 [Rubrivivax sp.]|nr:hypothetical protein [Rubrivivax sp.]
MSPHAYSEAPLVEHPAIGLFAALGWQTVSAREKAFCGTNLRQVAKLEALDHA